MGTRLGDHGKILPHRSNKTRSSKGLQGDDPKYLQVIATPKHFAVHSGPESTRHWVNVDATKHDMEDTYLPAFRATVTEGKARSVMCAYNRVNAEPACANAFLLEDQLRGAWKFDGYVVSDCDAVADIERGHHFTQTMAEAAAHNGPMEQVAAWKKECGACHLPYPPQLLPARSWRAAA